jgi:effector-binding domain-containing protein
MTAFNEDRTIRVKGLSPNAFVSTRGLVSGARLGETVSALFEEIWSHLNAQEHVTVGPPIVRYHGGDVREIAIEVGFPVAEPVPETDAIRNSELPGGNAATVLHWGDYSGLAEAWASLENWIEAEGLTPNGPRWEIYWVDPAQAKSESELRTELVWPVEKPNAGPDPRGAGA